MPDQRYFAFLRAINVGSRRLTNDELIEPFVALGLRDVAAYQAAGNITFRTEEPTLAQPGRLADRFSATLGFETDVFVRTRDELHAVSSGHPFSDDDLSGTEGRIQVSFLHAPPDARVVRGILELAEPDDRLVFAAREWFWLPRKGVSDSRLPMPKIERMLESTTTRTLGTIDRMLTKFGPAGTETVKA